jgi:hypothetical protein
MTMQTRTAIASILRQVAQGILSKEDAYHAISSVYYNLLPHN